MTHLTTPSETPEVLHSPASPTSYDQVPYYSHPYPQATPDRLATLATLMGLNAPPPERSRVLELGCCSGGNLIPLAARFPNATFVGVDSSHHQIALGQKAIVALALTNVRLQHHNILEITPDFGQFDYIICHGVFSWVPPAVQDKILAIASQNLAPTGVAYISYNAFPGWNMRGIIRDMMLYRTADFQRPADRVRHARGLVDFLVQSVPAEDNPYGMLVRRELESLQNKDGDYLFHEHLEDHNQPFYFHDFMGRAHAHRLKYLGEADFCSMSTSLNPFTASVLQTIANGRIDLEQYLDFLRNRMFRQTLLCHQDAPAGEEPLPKNLLGLFIASSAKPNTPVDPRTHDEAVFDGRHAVTKTTEPVMKAALLHLAEIWPRAASATELIAIARSRAHGEAVVVDSTHATADSRKVAEPLLRCFATSQIEVTATPSAFTTAISERPLAFPYARFQAQTSNLVTTMRHESCMLNDLQRHVLCNLDGSSDRNVLLDRLTALVAQGTLVLREGGRPVEAPAQVRAALVSPCEITLTQLAQSALLLA